MNPIQASEDYRCARTCVDRSGERFCEVQEAVYGGDSVNDIPPE